MAEQEQIQQGPGDDILSAIQGGKGDSVILKQFGINADQLTAFKSLNYGLSNQKMGYNQIKDYYPELKDYFKPESEPAPQATDTKAAQNATTIEKPDFTKPVREKKVAESTAPSLKASQQLAEGVLPGGTLQDKFDKKIAASQESLHKELRNNDDVVEKMIRTHRYEQAEQKGYDQFANSPRSDMPALAMLAGVRNQGIAPETKPQDLPVAPEEVGKLKSEIETNEPQARQFVNQVVVQKPEKAIDLQESMYMLDANERLKANPAIGLKVNENLNGIKEGKYKYNAQTRQVIEELGFLDGLVSGVKERTQQLENYNLKSLTPEERIKIMEQRLAAYDPDDPVKMPKGAGEFSQMLGMEWASILKSTATGVVTSLVGGEGAAPYISAAINAPEYYKRGYSSGYQQSYNELRQQGKSPEEADKLATEQAAYEGKLGAAEGAISTVVGGRIGLKELPKFKLTGGVRGAFNNMLKQTVHLAAETSIEGAADGMVAAVLQDKMNIAAREKGMYRDDESVKEAFMGELQFALATGGVVQAARGLIDPNTYKKLLYFLGKQPKETVQEKVGDMVLNGEMTQEQADDVITKTKEQAAVDKTVPEDIKDVSRIAMIEKIKERDALEQEKETVDKALRPPIQEKIDNLNKEILEHSTHKKETDDTETEAQTETGASGIADQTNSDQAGAEQSTVGAGETTATVPDPTNTEQHGPEAATIAESADVNAVAAASANTQEAASQESAEPQEAASANQEHYETSIGAKPTPNTGRIRVDPIVSNKPGKRISQIIKDVSVGLKQRVFYSKTPGAGGTYAPGSKGIKVRYNGNLAVTAHELGHSIDDHFDIYTKAAQNPAALQELSDYSNEPMASTPSASHPNPQKYILQEGFAEWLRHYVVNPKEAERLAPNVAQLYHDNVNEDFKKVIKQFSDDVRTWAGAIGRDVELSNVEYEPEDKGLLAKLFKKEETNNEFSVNWFDRLAANFLNPLNVFEKGFKYAKGIQGLAEVLPEHDPIILSRVLNGIDGKFGEILKSGMINGRGDVLKASGGVMLYDAKGRLIKSSGTVKNLEWLLAPLDNTDVASIKRDMKDVIDYMVAERTVELSKRFERGNLLTGLGGGIVSDFTVAMRTLRRLENGDPKRLARIQEAAARYREFADDTLLYAVDKGRLSQEQYDLIKENNVQYVALQRILEAVPGEEVIVVQQSGGKKLGSKSEITHTIKGSTKEIVNPYIPLLDTLFKTLRESDRNEVLQAFRDMLIDNRGMNEGQPKRLSDIGIRASPDDKNAITIFIKGKPEKWLFQKDIHRQLMKMDADGFRVHGLFTAPAKALRFFTVHFPAFAVRNWVKDLQDRIIKSTTGSGFKGMITGRPFRDLIGNKEDWHAIARAGGLNSGVYLKDKKHYYGLMTEAMTVMAKNKKIIVANPDLLKHAWHKYTDLLYKGETSNRVAEYRSAMRKAQGKGMDNYNAALYAAFKSRDLIDFAVMGHFMKVVNQVVPFSNAAVQGLRSGAVSFKTDPWSFMARMTIYSIIPGIAAWVWNHRNEEDEKQYEEIPSYQRDMFWNFRIGPNNWLSIPKPYELALPQAGIDRLLSYKYAGNEKAFDGYGPSIRKLLLPFDEGNLAGPYQGVYEGISNYDFFRERNIIPVDEDPLILALRHTETASRLGRLLQKYSGIDGRKWDHFIQRQFSYTGSFALKLSDIGVEGSRHEFDFTDTGLFKRSPAYNSVSVQKMIEYAKGLGLTKSPGYKGFNAIVGEYFKAASDEEKEKIGQDLIDYSKELLEAWKAADMETRKTERADAKKAAGR